MGPGAIQGMDVAGRGGLRVRDAGRLRPRATPTAPGGETEIRALRDEVRRLREQVAALAARTKEEDVRIPTYVRGLDAALQGGIPRGHVVGLIGPGGSMKTSLALYTLVRNRAAGTRGVFVTIEESRDSIVQTMRRLGLSRPKPGRSGRAGS